MENKGWIKLYRALLDSPYANNPDYSWLWVYLLLRARHKEKTIMWNGKDLIIKEGQLITGRKELSMNSGLTESKVYRILNYFEKEQQIEQQKTNKFTLITILNWSKYQSSEQLIEQQMNNKRTTNEQQVNTNKNDKKDKNDKNVIKIPSERKFYPEKSTEVKLSKYLYRKIKEKDKKFRVPNHQLWAKYIDFMIRIDNREPEEIEKVIDWCQEDSFWSSNILSTSKLRDKFTQLLLKMKDKNKKKESKKDDITKLYKKI